MDIIVKAMSGNLSFSDIMELIDKKTISKEDINGKILALLCSDHQNNKIMSNKIHEHPKDLNDSENTVNADHKTVTKILEEFYKIENCPSFLLHQSLLHNEDIDFAIEIYSKIFGLEIDEGCVPKLSNLLEKLYTKLYP